MVSLKTFLCIGMALVFVSGCGKKQDTKTAEKDAFINDNLYMSVPKIISVTQRQSSLFIIGKARPDGRVRIISNANHAIGLMSDSKGMFSFELNQSQQPSLYEVSVEVDGRFMNSDAKIFVPPLGSDRALLIRMGSPSQPLSRSAPLIAVVDFDGAGAMAVSGLTQKNTETNIMVGGQVKAKTTSDDLGLYSAVVSFDSAQNGPFELSVTSGSKQQTRQITLSQSQALSAQNSLDLSHQDQAMRIDYSLPAGGQQTSLIW